MTYGRWSKSSMVPLGLTVTLLTSLWRPSRRKRRNSWASCWLQGMRNNHGFAYKLFFLLMFRLAGSCILSRHGKALQKLQHKLRKEIAKAYLYPTNLGAYLWIWVLNSEGLTASLLDAVHMVCMILANSSSTEINNGIKKLNKKWAATICIGWCQAWVRFHQ